MKFAILSDIHGNIFALEECFKYIDELSVDAIIWCGDYITDIPCSHDILKYIKEKSEKYKSYIIKGNREDYIIKYHNSPDKNLTLDDRMGSIICVYNELTKEDLEYIMDLPDEIIIKEPYIPEIYVSHTYNEDSKYKYNIYGHSHKQELYNSGDIKYINSGSVGIPLSGFPGAEFMILELTEKYDKLTTYQVKYDINKPINAIKNGEINNIGNKWGDLVIKALETTVDYPNLYLEEAKKVAIENGFDGDLDDIPLNLWHRARKNLLG